MRFFKLKILPVLLIFSFLLSMIGMSLVFAAESSSFEGEKIYFNTSQNTEWAPASGFTIAGIYINDSEEVLAIEKLQKINENLYSGNIVSGVDKIQFIVYDQDKEVPIKTERDGYTRVFFNNNDSQIPQPYVYVWDDSENYVAAWPGTIMEQVGNTDYWYYDCPPGFSNIIFSDGSSNNQTEDLTVPSSYAVFSDMSKTTWDSAPYYSLSSTIDIRDHQNGTNEIYVDKNNNLTLSNYPYPSRYQSQKQTVYLYNPNWDRAYVVFDKSDPYREKFLMEPLSGEYVGFFRAEVPSNAKISFSPNEDNDYGSSIDTAIPLQYSQKCYQMINGSELWCELSDAKGETADYYVPHGSAADSSSAYWVDATYYDYLSDAELSGSWLNPTPSGTGFNNSWDDWYPFNSFNERINQQVLNSNLDWRYPLYFGNFSNPDNAYAITSHNGPYSSRVAPLLNFNYSVNNSNGMNNLHRSVINLANNTLDEKGNIQPKDQDFIMPYFDSQWLRSNSAGKVIRSSFPFRASKQGNTTVYSFNSTDANDNVYFDFNGSIPQTVEYGQGASYGIKDGIDYFMNPDDWDEEEQHNYRSGYGFFPFNNTTNTKGNKSSNENLNYGFGVKLNLDFKVSENGMISSTEAAKFEYSGDDDLWVYLSEYDNEGNMQNSQLILDLGGTHKKSKGVIDFSTMTSTAEKVAEINPSITYNPNEIYINDNFGWGQWMRVWAWDDNGNGEWYTPEYRSDINKYVVSKLQVGSKGTELRNKTHFKVAQNEEWWGETAEATLGDHFGNICYTDNLPYYEPKSNTITNTDNYETHFGFESDHYGTLNPNRIYHLTIFYMERGMIESNCNMSFSLTPANNDLRIKKVVDTSEINPALAPELNQHEFSFIPSDANDLSYNINGDTSSQTFNGSIKLKNEDVADFNNQYSTGKEITVSEVTDAGIQFDTTWELVDNTRGTLILSGKGKETSPFIIEDPVNQMANANIQATFTNTPKLSDFEITKSIVDKSGQELDSTNSLFTFIFKLDLNGGINYLPYGLKYTVETQSGETHSYMMSQNGVFSFNSTDTVKIKGLPVGATYSLEEAPRAGYLPYVFSANNSSQSFSTGAITGNISEQSIHASIKNKQNPSSATVSAAVLIDDMPYSGSLFSYKINGIPSITFTDSNGTHQSVDTSNEEKSTTIASSGFVSFTNTVGEDMFKYTEEGIYLYEISETGLNNPTYESDITLPTIKYIAKVNVVGEGTNLIVNDPEFFEMSIDKDSYVNENFVLPTTPIFKNTTTKATVTVEKENVAGEKQEGVGFTIYKTTGINENLGEEYKTEITNSNGTAIIGNISIFEDGYNESDAPAYQWYCLVETNPKDGFSTNSTKHYFRFPMTNQATGDKVYSATYEYVNHKIVSPVTAGEGHRTYILTGIMLVLIATVIILLSKIYSLKNKKGGKHFA